MMQRLLPLFLLLYAACDLRAVNLLAPPEVSAADAAATLRWKLDSAAGGRVRFGLAPDKLDQSATDAVGTEHTLTLRGLKPGTKYFYSLGTSRHDLTTGSFIAGGGTPAAKNATPSQPDAPAPPPKKTLLQKITGLTSKPTPSAATPVPPIAKNAIVRDAPATRKTWGNIGSLPDHFARHGGDFSAKSADDYAAQAWRFRERASTEHLPMKLDPDGTVRVFDAKTRAFASFNRDGTTKTYFRPDSASYWQRQPGRAIQTPPWISQ